MITVIRDLRNSLQMKKISFYDCFKLLDEDEDGVITINEFIKNLDKVINFSTYIKDGLFAFFDVEKIGMID